MLAALAEAGAVLERDDYLDAARACADFLLRELRDGRRPPAAHLEGRPRAARRLARGPRLPARGAADAVRGDVRGALVRGGACARRHDDRPLRRRRARRLLLHRRRPRAARRPPQGPRGHPDPVRAIRRGARPAAARAPDRRAAYEERARHGRAAAPDRRRDIRSRSRTCCRRSTSSWPTVREVAIVGDPTRAPLVRTVRAALPPARRAGRRRRRRRSGVRCSWPPTGRRPAPRRTCASGSPARPLGAPEGGASAGFGWSVGVTGTRTRSRPTCDVSTPRSRS